MIDLIYSTLLTILNKENRGYITPTEFNILANNTQLEIFRSYFEDENLDKNKSNRGISNKGYSNLDFNERQRINQFAEIQDISISVDRFILPTDLYFIEDDGVSTNNKVVEEVERGLQTYLGNSLGQANTLYPVYERYSSYIIVKPSTITEINLRYLRLPKMPNWTYIPLPNSFPAFDPSNLSFQDFELHDSEFTNIVNRMLLYFGVNLREQEIQGIANNLKDRLTVKESQ